MKTLEAAQAWFDNYEAVDPSYCDSDLTARFLVLPASRLVTFLREGEPVEVPMAITAKEFEDQLSRTGDPIEAAGIIHQWIAVKAHAIVESRQSQELHSAEEGEQRLPSSLVTKRGNWQPVPGEGGYWHPENNRFNKENAKFVCCLCQAEAAYQESCPNCASTDIALGCSNALPGLFCLTCGEGSIVWTCPSCHSNQKLSLAFRYDAEAMRLQTSVGFLKAVSRLFKSFGSEIRGKPTPSA